METNHQYNERAFIKKYNECALLSSYCVYFSYFSSSIMYPLRVCLEHMKNSCCYDFYAKLD